MAKIPRRYPLSTADGQAIPLDVIRPSSLLAVYTLADSGSAAASVPADIELMTLLATVDSFVQFFSVATAADALVPGTAVDDALFLPANLLTVVSPPIDKPYFSVRAIAISGVTYVQFLESWTGLTLQSQINRR